MQHEEPRDFPRGSHAREVVVNHLVHEPGDSEGREHSHRSRTRGPKSTSRQLTDGKIYGGTQYTAYHEVPPTPPEILQRGSEVGFVELRLYLQADGPSRGGAESQNKFGGDVHVAAVESQDDVWMQQLSVLIDLQQSS